MNSELQGKLVEILTSIQMGVGQAKDFAVAQLPDIAQSYIVYGRVFTSIIVLLAVVVFVAALTACLKIHRAAKMTESYYDGFFPWFPGSLVMVISVFVISVNLSKLILVWFAPKVWLLQELARMVK